MQKLIYDVGVCDGTDTEYYLRCGYEVIGIEANPRMVKLLKAKFSAELAQGRFKLLNIGVAEQDGELDFWVSDLPEWSSFDRSIASRNGTGHHLVQVTTSRFEKIVAAHGVPYYCKIDIEGNDWLCLAGMTAETAPKYLSIEMSHAQGDRDLAMLSALGYSDFKIVSQVTRAQPIQLITALGYRLPPRASRLSRKLVKRLLGVWRSDGWQFPSNSSGGFGENTPGSWKSSDHTLRTWQLLHDIDLKYATHGLGEWFDIHARMK